MIPPTKDQADIGVENETIDCSDGADIPGKDEPNKDLARQEFKQEADINYMLSRFGITQPREAPAYGEWDDSISLQSALQAVAEAREGFNTLPEDMRRKFNNMEELLTAVQAGKLVIEDGEAPAPVPTTEELLQERIRVLEDRITAPRAAATQSE